MTAELKLIGMGETQASRDESDFSCIGVGSGIVVAAYDPKQKVGGLGHFILPCAPSGPKNDRPAKYVDTGMAQMFNEMFALGATRSNLRIALVGGSRLLMRGDEEHARCNLGVRNVESAYRLLAEFGVACRAQEIGGQVGRTVTFSGKNGTVKVRVSPESDRVLCNLRG